MSSRRPIQERVAEDAPAPGPGLVVTLGVLACAVIAHAIAIDWRPSPGGNPWLVPVIASTLLFICSLLLGLRLSGRARAGGKVSRRRSAGTGLATVLTAAWGMGFFHAAQTLGLIAATFLFTAAGMLLLSPRPGRALRVVLPLALAVAAGFWLMFTRLAPIMLSDPLLW